MSISRQRQRDIIDALRLGTVPRQGLELFAVGMERFESVIDDELANVARGHGAFKAVRGEYGSGKTFFSRWLQERAKRASFAVSEVQISETETPLHRLETVYRRLMERLSTPNQEQAAFRSIVDSWVYALEEDLLAGEGATGLGQQELVQRVNDLMEKRLSAVARSAPAFSAALRAYRTARAESDSATADALLSWLSAQPNVGASAKRKAGIKGDVDHSGALCFLQGLLTILRDSGFSGLVLVLDEVETLQRARSDVRERGLNSLRQLVDELHSGRFPGLYLLITGTPAFFDGPQGVQRLPPLAQRLHVEFDADPKYDNPRAVQIRLSSFNLRALVEIGCRVRNLFAEVSPEPERVLDAVPDAYVEDLAKAIAGRLGGKIGLAPRLFLKKLISEVLDRVELFPEFDPRRDYALTLSTAEMSEQERAVTVDDIELRL